MLRKDLSMQNQLSYLYLMFIECVFVAYKKSVLRYPGYYILDVFHRTCNKEVSKTDCPIG